MLLGSTQKFLRELHHIGAVKVNTDEGFRLAMHDIVPTAPLSPFYINLRTPENKGGPLLKHHIESIATELMQAAMRRHISFDAVAGIPRAGTPFAKAIVRHTAQTTPKAFIPLYKRSATSRAMYVRRDSEAAKAARGKRVLIVDDLITRADTKRTAIEAVQRAGFDVAGIAVYLNRQQGGLEELRREGIPTVAVVNVNEMFDFYKTEGLIAPKDLNAIKEYLRR